MELVSGIWAQWNIPNFLTTIRALSILIIAPLVFYEQWGIAAFLALVSAATDAEGELARRTNTMTELGKVLDPIADKLFVNSMFLLLLYVEGSLLLLVLAMVNFVYDVDNTCRRIGDIVNACYNKQPVPRKVSAPVTKVSKTKSALLFVVVILLLFSHAVATDLVWVVDGLMSVALALVLVSWFQNRRDLFFR